MKTSCDKEQISETNVTEPSHAMESRTEREQPKVPTIQSLAKASQQESQPSNKELKLASKWKSLFRGSANNQLRQEVLQQGCLLPLGKCDRGCLNTGALNTNEAGHS